MIKSKFLIQDNSEINLLPCKNRYCSICGQDNKPDLVSIRFYGNSGYDISICKKCQKELKDVLEVSMNRAGGELQ